MVWVIDLDGVVWLGDEPISGAAAAVSTLRAAGNEVVFVTNNSSRRLAEFETALERCGIPAQGAVISSAMVAASMIGPGESALVCAGDGVREALAGRGVEMVDRGDADVVVVGWHRDFDFAGLTRAADAVRNGARLVATGTDSTYPTPDGLLPGTGAILAAVATASGGTPVVAGKPHGPIAALVRERFGPDGIVVGDRPDTDGAYARALGYGFVLVLSGVTGPLDLPTDPAPDWVLDDLASAVDLLVGSA